MSEKNDAEDVKAQDLSPAMMARESAPKKTWFFERGDGMIFACEEREAWDLVNNRSEWKRRDFKIVGVSDGTTYQKVVRESIAQAKVLEPEISRLKEELKRYERAEEKLIMDEAVDMEGDSSDAVNEGNKQKVLRLRGIIDRLDAQLEEKEAAYKSIVSDVVKRATEAELEVARGTIEWPSDMNIMTPDSDQRTRNKILKLMGGV